MVKYQKIKLVKLILINKNEKLREILLYLIVKRFFLNFGF